MTGARQVDVYTLAVKHALSVRSVWNIIRDAGLEIHRGAPTERSTVNAADFARAFRAAPRRPRAKRV